MVEFSKYQGHKSCVTKEEEEEEKAGSVSITITFKSKLNYYFSLAADYITVVVLFPMVNIQYALTLTLDLFMEVLNW